MIFIGFVICFSFFAELIFSTFLPANTLFNPLFTIISFIIVYPYFKNKNISFLKTCVLTGFLYDLIGSDTFLVNTFLFFLLGLILIGVNIFLTNHLFSCLFLTLFLIVVYRSMYYAILLLCGYVKHPSVAFFTSITHSLLINIFYCIFLYGVTEIIRKRFKIEKRK